MTASLCLLLGAATVGTIVVSAAMMAGVSVAGAYGYLSAMTTIVMPVEHWQGAFEERFLQAVIVTSLLVVGTAVYRTWQLSEEGGGWLARSLGGTRVLADAADPSHVKLRNVVEELAIATSLRTPAVYLLEDEPGINAFAAGLDTKDAVVGVTRGAVEKLKRHQLQGVIAHEFSHIVNGDMRLNLRLLGILSGIQVISFIAQYLLRLAMPVAEANGSRGSDKHPLGMLLALVFGAALWPIGQIGTLFARVIHMAVNRQREFLADASAVQFTRDPHGLCEALTVLLEEQSGSRIRRPAVQFASHMFFATDKVRWQRWFATHPPLEERIRRLDPAISIAGRA